MHPGQWNTHQRRNRQPTTGGGIHTRVGVGVVGPLQLPRPHSEAAQAGLQVDSGPEMRHAVTGAADISHPVIIGQPDHHPVGRRHQL